VEGLILAFYFVTGLVPGATSKVFVADPSFPTQAHRSAFAILGLIAPHSYRKLVIQK
jgi:hypothetical protein